MKRWLILTIISSLAMYSIANMTDVRHQLESASQAYLAGDFALAAEQYEQVISAGYESAALYFNLGNAYFKLNQVPAAILYYEKALKLDPADESTQFNLELANSRIIDKIDPLPELFLRTWLRDARNLFPSDLWAKAGVACFIILLIATLIFLTASSVVVRKISFWAGILLFIAISLSLLFSISSYRDYSQKDSAIIFTPTVTVKSSPNENSVDLFVIHEGTKVFITDRIENWSEVRLVNGNVGWLKTETFRPI